MLRSKDGRALIIVIIIMAILMILGPAIVASSNVEVKHTTKYENNIQAQLYARSGVDAALDWLIDGDGLLATFEDENTYDGWAYMSGNLMGMDVYMEDQYDNKDITVTINDTGSGVLISSVGKYNSAEKVMEVTLVLTIVGGEDFTMPAIDKALFVIAQGTAENPSFRSIGGPKVIGSFGANTTGTGSLVFQNKQTIEGDMYLHAHDSEDVVVAGGSPNVGDIYVDQPEIVYPNPDFPDIPASFESYSEYNLKMTSGTLTLDKDYEFGDIVFSVGKKDTLSIDLGGQDREIVCDSFTLAKGSINIIGTENDATLSIHVKDVLDCGSKTTINTGAEGDDIHDVTFFYSGTETPDISNTSLLKCNLVTETSGYYITGNGGIQGHLIIGGTDVQVGGTADLITRVIYAPNAHVIIHGTGYVKGAIVANTAVLTGTSDLEYDPSDITGLPGGILPGVGEPIPGSGTEATRVISSYYWQ